MTETAQVIGFPTVDRKAVITELFEVREKIAEIEAGELKKLKKRRKEIEDTLIGTMEVGEKASFAGIGTVSCSEETVPSVDDWDDVYAYILKNNAFYLLARKLNAAPYRESLNIGEEIPGVSSVKLRKLNVRKA